MLETVTGRAVCCLYTGYLQFKKIPCWLLNRDVWISCTRTKYLPAPRPLQLDILWGIKSLINLHQRNFHIMHLRESIVYVGLHSLPCWDPEPGLHLVLMACLSFVLVSPNWGEFHPGQTFIPDWTQFILSFVPDFLQGLHGFPNIFSWLFLDLPFVGIMLIFSVLHIGSRVIWSDPIFPIERVLILWMWFLGPYFIVHWWSLIQRLGILCDVHFHLALRLNLPGMIFLWNMKKDHQNQPTFRIWTLSYLLLPL